MSSLLSHATKSEIEYCYKDNLLPVEVVFIEDAPSLIKLSNDEKINSSCLNCSAKPCLMFNDIVQTKIVDVIFSKDVCPTSALYLDEFEQVVVDKENCIGCGLCMLRCETGAIYMHKNKATIHRDVTDLVQGKLLPVTISYKYDKSINIEKKLKRLSVAIIENKKPDSLIINNLFKSLFMALGFKVAKPRVGDVNLRMDLIVDTKEKLYLVEVDNLGSPETIRDIIDDVAIFSDKYNKDLSSLAGVACIIEFPNKRSEYYELISDVENVLGFNIYSLSLGVLLLSLFSRKEINIERFHINEKQTSSRSMLDEAFVFSKNSKYIEASK